jgi:hypothetical protein
MAEALSPDSEAVNVLRYPTARHVPSDSGLLRFRSLMMRRAPWTSVGLCAFGALVALTSAALTSVALTSQAREGGAEFASEFVWSAPEGCPSAAFLQAEVARIVGRPWAVIEGGWRSVAASARAEASGGVHVAVEVVALDGGKSERSLTASSCTEAGEAVVAILTASVAPSLRGSSVEAAPVAGPAPPAASTDRSGNQAEPAQLVVRPVIVAELGLDVATLSGAVPFGQFAAGLELGRFAALGFAGSTTRVLGEVEGSAAGAEMSLLMAGLLGCARVAEGRVSPSVCAGFELGRLGARGVGTSAARDGSAFWSASLVRGTLDFGIDDASAVSLGVAAVVPFRQLHVVLRPEEVHRTPAVAVRPFVGFGVRFR